MPITFDRSVCCDLNETISREWLVANGLGGYAAGTVAGTLTRLEQGLLVASPQESTMPQLLVAKMDEEIVFDQRTYYLGTNEYKDGTLNPAGFVHLETFRLEEGFPVFTYHLGGIDGIMLEKRIWMPQGLNTTYIQYRLLRTYPQQDITPWNNRALHPANTRFHDEQRVLSLTLLPFAAYRACNEEQHGNLDWQFQVETQHTGQDDRSSEDDESIAGCTIRAWDGARPYHIFAVGHAGSETTFLPTGVWYWNLQHRENRAGGKTANGDLYLPGVFRTRLWPGENVSFTIIITAEDLSRQSFSAKQLNRAYNEAVDYQRNILQTQRYFGEGGVTAYTHALLPFPERNDDLPQGEEFLRLLVQAANRFLAERPAARNDAGAAHSLFFPDIQNIPVVIPGYYGARESTRDTLIALPGLLLSTRRYAEARRVLSNLGRYFKQGLLPDRLPTPPEPLHTRDYGSIDTTLWYFYALDHYIQATRDYDLLDSLFDKLAESIEWHTRGTLNGIGVDEQDGLLQAREPGNALTWMNATLPEALHKPAIPRQGKAVEVNALWFHALSLMHEWAEHLNRTWRINYLTERYEEQRQQCRRSFNERFWYDLGGYLYDVIDGPDGDDARIRPNQLFALSLRYAVLDETHQRSVLNVITQHLLTPRGLRTLSPQANASEGQLQDRLEEQQSDLHQGSAWPWLIGPYVDALLRVEGHAPVNRKKRIQETQRYRESVWRKGIQLLDTFREQLRTDMLGMIGSVYDGNGPLRPYTYVASALSTAELLRVYKLLANIGVRFSEQVLSV
ncbi:MAG TPA: amylo-alpha-1,6-glucosidase [Ktedonobacteraceae bacterium]|nr:amylo-alpha-1,6-glucosidase [Ktedonobacteraceae bacterium]